MIDYKNIAYLPIDLPRITLDEQIIKQTVDQHNTLHHGGIWKCLPLIGGVQDQAAFNDPVQFDQAWRNRYKKPSQILYNQKYYHALKPLFDHLELLPLIITHAQILNQTKDIGKHFDLKHDDNATTWYDDYPGMNSEWEPACYKVLLNNFDKKSFYVSEGFKKPNHYIKLPEDTSTFVISEKKYPHGATQPDTPKYIVSIFGILDSQKHQDLLAVSYQKYKDFVIQFN